MSTNNNSNANASEDLVRIPDSKQKNSDKWTFMSIFHKKWRPQPQIEDIIVLFTGVGIVLIIVDQFDGKIFLLYGIENFYQNHRRYLNSRSNKQLAGIPITMSEALTYCHPAVRNQDLFKNESFEGHSLVQTDVAYPCGLVAQTMFNDTYSLYHYENQQKGDQITISDKGIVWPDEIGNVFAVNPEYRNQYWINVEDEHFIVWMRTSGLSNFRKLWGILDKEYLAPGQYQIQIQNNYNIQQFNGHKNIILSTSSHFGGKNYFISSSFLFAGAISICIAVAFKSKFVTSKGAFGRSVLKQR